MHTPLREPHATISPCVTYRYPLLRVLEFRVFELRGRTADHVGHVFTRWQIRRRVLTSRSDCLLVARAEATGAARYVITQHS